MLLDEIGSYLQSVGVGAVGSTIFKGDLPDEPVACLALLDGPSSMPDFAHGTDGPNIEYPRFQIIARGTREAGGQIAARQLADNAYVALCRVVNLTLSGTRYLRIEPLQTPFLIGRDANGNVQIGANFEATKVPS